ncbi:MAG: hypothetical protein R3A52_20960 [Polyangiales bacterium]
MKTRTLQGSLLMVALAACSSTQNNRGTTPATNANGNTVVTAGNTAVNETANSRFNAAAQAMRTHDAANDGRGDWNPDACNQVAGMFEQAAQANNNGQFPDAWFNRALVFDRCGMTDPETQALNRALQAANNNYCRARVQLGVLAYRRNDVAAAQQAYEEAIRQDQTHCVEGYTNLAHLLRERNPSSATDWQPVIRNIRSALALDDRYLPARNELALAYLQQAGDDPNSRLIFLAGLVAAQAIQVGSAQQAELTPNVRSFMADLYNTWGLIDIRRNEIIKALEHFRRAYTLNPSMYEAWVNYGTINLSFRGYQDARDAFEHALQLRDNSYDAHIGLGVALRGLAAQSQQESERPALLQRAQAEYERARTIDAARADAYYNLGVLHMNYMSGISPDMQNLDNAERYLNEFMQHAQGRAQHADAVTRATRYIRNIRETRTALQAVGGGTTTTPTPAPATPPAATPPAASPTTNPAPGPATMPPAAPAAGG